MKSARRSWLVLVACGLTVWSAAQEPTSLEDTVPEATAAPGTRAPASPARVIQVPVEVISAGSAPRWVEVKVRLESVPEPGTAPLILLPALWCLFRRKR